MSLRDSFFAMTYDRQMGKTEEAGLRDMRKRLLAGAKGRVLEIGSGTGANLPWYGPEVESLTMTEPVTPMVRRLERRLTELGSGRPASPSPRSSTPRCPRRRRS